MRETLSYPPKPPGDRVGVVWRGDDVEITLPPRITPRAFVVLLVLAALAIVGFACAWADDGTARFAGASVRLGHGSAGRAVAAATGAGAALGWVWLLRQARTWTRFDVHGGTLTRIVPSLVGLRATQYPFDSVVGATVARPEDHGGQWHLILRRRDGGASTLLENTVYRAADMEQVAAALREAVDRRHRSDQPREPIAGDVPTAHA